MYTAFNRTQNNELELVLWDKAEMPDAEYIASQIGVWNNDVIQLLKVEYDYREDVYPISGPVRVRILDSRREQVIETKRARVRNVKGRMGWTKRVTEWK